MRRAKDEKGYTLIIVLLIITLLLAFSAVFIASSMNHATQERTVETGNQAIAAAEMGVEYTVLFTRDALEETYESVVNAAVTKANQIKSEAKKYPEHSTVYHSCGSDLELQRWVDCNYNQLVQEYKIKFNDEVRVLRDKVNLARTPLKVNDPKTLERNMKFTVTSYNLADGYIEFEVLGNSGEFERSLTGRVEVPDPVMLIPDEKNQITISQTKPPENLVQLFPQLKKEELPICPSKPSRNMGSCEYEGLLTSEYLSKVSGVGVGSDFYIKVNNIDRQLNNFNGYGIPLYIRDGLIESEPNLNNSTNMTMYYEGLLAVKNLNNSSNHFWMAERITFQNNQNLYNSTFVLVGNTSKPSFSPSKLTINSGSRLCLNKDYLQIPSTLLDIGNLKQKNSDLNYAGSGVIYVFTSQKPLPTGNAHVRYFNDTIDFLESCGVRISVGESETRSVDTPVFFPNLNADYDIEINYE